MFETFKTWKVGDMFEGYFHPSMASFRIVCLDVPRVVVESWVSISTPEGNIGTWKPDTSVVVSVLGEKVCALLWTGDKYVLLAWNNESKREVIVSGEVSTIHEWRRMGEFQAGDFIHRWGDDLPVLEVRVGEQVCTITYTDTDGEEKSIINRSGEEYIALKRTV
jgi:hypothetical protein